MMMSTDSHSPSEIQEILRLKNVAVVGMSNTDGKPANFVPKYLIENGYNVIPVNPTTNEVLGRKSYANRQSFRVNHSGYLIRNNTDQAG
jgi:uncharacterized protein